MRRPCSLASLVILVVLCVPRAHGGDLRITLPKRTKPTPVQQLNRDGVRAVQKHDYEKAKKLFYKAYLLDPDDPFTLNNLGYISELEGEIERAQRYYALAADLSSDATVDKASLENVQGKSVAEVAGNAEDNSLQINRLNVQAMALLMHDRAGEAELVLGKALALDQHNPYTLNNIGYAREQEGEYESALSYYSAAAATRSKDPIVVTINKSWRGKPISQVAADNAKKVRESIEHMSEDASAQVARLNLRGVSAINRNDLATAKEDFQKAYKLDDSNAFTLNNMGYLAELEGDRETAQSFYAKAKDADEAHRTIGVATRKDAEGQQLTKVADDSDQKVDASMEAALALKRSRGGPVALKRRDGSTVVEPAEPVRPKLPASDQPPPTEQQIMPPLPDNQQPPSVQQPQQPVQGQPATDIIPPLPDNQQPPAVQQQKPQTQPPPAQGQPAQDILPPLPDNQQPPENQQQQRPKPPQPKR